MAPDDTCLGFGFLISLLVSTLKRIPLVSRYPKMTAGVLAVCVALVRALPTVSVSAGSAQLVPLGLCVASQLAAAIATHEVVTGPVVARAIATANGRVPILTSDSHA